MSVGGLHLKGLLVCAGGDAVIELLPVCGQLLGVDE